MKRLIAMGLIVIAGCSSGVTAPEPANAVEVCADAFCLEIPDGWTVVNGGDYVSAVHEDDPDHTFLTAAAIDSEAIVEAAGGGWPATTAEVSRAFWTLLDQAEVGTFERSARMIGGAERSWGTHEGSQMWHLVFPTGSTSAVGIEIRGPNDSWETHADVVFASVQTR